MKLSNYWNQDLQQSETSHPASFVNTFDNYEVNKIDESWRRVIPVVSELRNSVTARFYSQDSIDNATMSVARFVSKLPDDVLTQKQLVDFDIQMEESIEFVFSGRQRVRVNLMFDAMNTYEEAFIFYQQNGRLTQSNGYMADVIEILRHIL